MIQFEKDPADGVTERVTEFQGSPNVQFLYIVFH